jgi:hypothetical protein
MKEKRNTVSLGFPFSFICFICGTRDKSEHYTLGNQFYGLRQAPVVFAFSLFSDTVSHFYPELASDRDPPTSTSGLTGITSVNHHTQSFLGFF